MAKIDSKIPQQTFEIVRKRVFDILGDELNGQLMSMGNYEADADVYLERYMPFHEEEVPSVNVTLATGEYNGQTAITSPGTYRYFIDCYQQSATTGPEDEESYDRLAMQRLGRLIGIVRAIIEDARYLKLGFDDIAFIGCRYIEKIMVADPNAQDAAGMVRGRLVLVVQVNESVALKAAAALAGIDSTVQLSDSDAGYVFRMNV